MMLKQKYSIILRFNGTLAATAKVVDKSIIYSSHLKYIWNRLIAKKLRHRVEGYT